MADAEKGLKRYLECLFCCVAVFLTAFYISASSMTGYVKQREELLAGPLRHKESLFTNVPCDF